MGGSPVAPNSTTRGWSKFKGGSWTTKKICRKHRIHEAIAITLPLVYNRSTVAQSLQERDPYARLLMPELQNSMNLDTISPLQACTYSRLCVCVCVCVCLCMFTYVYECTYHACMHVMYARMHRCIYASMQARTVAHICSRVQLLRHSTSEPIHSCIITLMHAPSCLLACITLS